MAAGAEWVIVRKREIKYFRKNIREIPKATTPTILILQSKVEVKQHVQSS